MLYQFGQCGLIWTYLDKIGHILICWELFGAILSYLKKVGFIWSHLKLFGAIWIYLNQLRPIWTHLDQLGHSLTQLRKRERKKKVLLLWALKTHGTWYMVHMVKQWTAISCSSAQWCCVLYCVLFVSLWSLFNCVFMVIMQDFFSLSVFEWGIWYFSECLVFTWFDTIGPFCTYLDSFGPIWSHFEQFGHIWTYFDPFGPI